MKKISVLIFAAMLAFSVVGQGVRLGPLAGGLYAAMDSFVALTPDAISDFVYDVDSDGNAEFGRRIIGRPDGLPEMSDDEFPAALEMLWRAVSAAERHELPHGVYRSYQATGGGPKFTQRSTAYRINTGSGVGEFTIDNALDEEKRGQHFKESGAYRLTRDEYVCAQYIVDRVRVIGPTRLRPIEAMYESAGKAKKVKHEGKALNVKTVNDPRAKEWRRAYELFSSHLLSNEYIHLTYNRAKRYICLADKSTGMLYAAAYRNGKFYIIKTKASSL